MDIGIENYSGIVTKKSAKKLMNNISSDTLERGRIIVANVLSVNHDNKTVSLSVDPEVIESSAASFQLTVDF